MEGDRPKLTRVLSGQAVQKHSFNKLSFHDAACLFQQFTNWAALGPQSRRELRERRSGARRASGVSKCRGEDGLGQAEPFFRMALSALGETAGSLVFLENGPFGNLKK